MSWLNGTANGNLIPNMPSSGLADVVRATTDPITGGISFSDEPAMRNAIAPITGGLRAILWGHSYMDQELATTTVNRPVDQAYGTVNWANMLLGRPWEVMQGQGIGGERVSDVYARADLLTSYPSKPNIIFFNLGINDLKNTVNAGNSRATGLPYLADPRQTDLTYVIEYMDKLIEIALKTANLVVLLPETSPANSAADQTAHLAARALQLNRYYRHKAMATSRLFYAPLDAVTYDPASAAGNVKTGYYKDTIHPSTLGAFTRGSKLAAVLKPILTNAIDRLPYNVIETFSNLKIAGTSITAQGNGTCRVMLANVASTNTLIRTGDAVSLSIPSSGNTGWNGTWNVVAYASTYIDVDCPVAGTYTGTVNVSTAEQMFDNPLLTTTTGGAASGGITLTGTLPAAISIYGSAGNAVTASIEAHTDFSGAADGLGNWLKLVFTVSANATVGVYALTHRGDATIASPYNGRFHQGDTVQCLMDVDVLATPSGVAKFLPGCTYTYNDGSSHAVGIEGLYWADDNTDGLPDAAWRGVVGTSEYKIPSTLADVSAMDGKIEITAGASGATISIRIGRIGFWRVARPERDASLKYNL